MNIKKLLWGGSILVGTTILIIVYSVFTLLGITQTPLRRYELEIKTESLEKVYDGTPLTSNTWSIQSGSLEPNHTLYVTMNNSITYPGSIPNKIGVTILDEENKDVTNYYHIIYDIGTLTVKKVYLHVHTQSFRKVYDGTPLTSDKWSILSGTLLPNHTIHVSMTSSITDPGSIPNDIGVTILDENNNDATFLYNIIYDLGTLTVDKIDISIRTESKEKIYDGIPLSNNVWSLYKGRLLTKHSINVTMTSSITNPGTISNDIGVTILDDHDKDVTYLYNINYQLGTLTVYQLDISIQTESMSKVYDGEPLSCHVWSIQSGTLLDKHTINVTMTSSITNPGSVKNEIGVTIFDENNNDVTSLYNIDYDLGTLTVKKIDISIKTESKLKSYDGKPLTSNIWSLQSGTLLANHTINVNMNNSITDPGTIFNDIGVTIFDENNNDVTSIYNINYDLGTLTVRKIDLAIKTESKSKIYDGIPLTSDVWLIESGSLLDKHTINVSMTSTITTPGSIYNEIKVTIFDENNKNVTNIYYITYDLGTLTVRKIDLTIKTESKSKLYDGTPLISNMWSIESGALSLNHNINVRMTSSITYPGSIENKIGVTILDENNNDITSCYNITYDLGTLTIRKIDLAIKTESKTKTYDGTPLTSNNWLIESGTLLINHTIDVNMTSSITNPGSIINGLGVTIFDENHHNVTSWYNITYDLGTLTVKKIDLTIKTESKTKTYDGIPLSCDIWSIQSGTLFANHHINGTMNSSITDPGTILNEIGVTIVDEYNNDVTSIYNITYNLGSLIVKKVNITVKTESMAKIYDGTPLSCDIWSLQSGTLFANHHINVKMNSSITNPGSTLNEIGVTIVDEYNNDVTSIYNITYNLGLLTVKKIDLKIKTESKTKIYDGTPLSCDIWSIQSGSLLENHTIQANMTSSITLPGSIPNEIGVTILDEYNSDVTSIYNIIYNLGSLTIRKIDITIQTERLNKIYDGTPLFSKTWSIQSGSLLENHTIQANMTSSITLPGSIPNEIGVTIFDENNNDVTYLYNINYNLGVLKIEKIVLTLKSGSANKVYDGTPLTCQEWSFVNGTLLPNHELQVDVVGEITEVGSIDNLIHAYVVDESGTNVNIYYDFHLQLGKLTILSSIYSTGDISRNAQEPSNETVMQIYATKSGSVYLRDLSWGNYTMQAWGYGKPHNIVTAFNPLTLSAKALEESGKQANIVQIKYLRENIPYLVPYYAIDTFTNTNDVHIYGNIDSINTFNYISYDYVSSSKVLLSNSSYTELERKYREFVYDNYLDLPESTRLSMLQLAQENHLDPSKPTIIADVKRYIQNAAVYNLHYKPIPDDVDIAVYFLTTSKEGICQHFATAATVMYRALGIPARYVTGYLGQATANSWVDITDANAHAWVEVYIDGMGWVQVEVTGSSNRPKITVMPKPVILPYSEGCEPIKASSLNIFGFKEFEDKGYSYHVTFSGELSTAGKGISIIDEFIIYDDMGNNVTNMFDITYETGILQLYLYEITFRTEGANKTYDGKALINSKWYVIGELAEGHTIDGKSIIFTGSQINIGLSKNTAKLIIVDEDGNDVTSMYLVNYEYGDLIVTPRYIKVQSKNASKPYDGTPLICHEYEIVSGSLVNGDRIEVEISGTQTNIGKSDNIIKSIRILNGSEDVTFNYLIELTNGKLIVTPAISS